jgi:hypothetical protein
MQGLVNQNVEQIKFVGQTQDAVIDNTDEMEPGKASINQQV